MKNTFFSFIIIIAASFSLKVFGTDYTWNVLSGDWSTASNWNPSTGFPSSDTDNASLINAEAATTNLYSNVALDLTINNLQVGIYNELYIYNTGGNLTDLNCYMLSTDGGKIYGRDQSSSYTNSSTITIATTTDLKTEINFIDINMTADVGSGLNAELTGPITGTSTLTKSGTGILILSGTNEYSGGTTLNAGTLKISDGSSLGNGTVTFYGGTLGINNDLTLANNISMKTGTIEVDSGTTANLSGIIEGEGDGDLTKSGLGTLVLSGDNTYTGTTTLSEGILSISNSSNLGSGDIYFTGGTLYTSAGLTLANNVSIDTDTTGTIEVPSDTTTLSGIISGDGNLIKSGNGTLVLSGDNTYSGGTTVSAGNLQGTTTSIQGDIAMGENTKLILNQNVEGTYAGIISGEGSVSMGGEAFFTLTGANTYTGGTTVKDLAKLTGNSTSLQGDFSVDFFSQIAFNQSFDGTFNGTIDGLGNFFKLGTGKLTYAGNTLTQTDVIIVAGELYLYADSESHIVNITTAAKTVTISAGATLSGYANISQAVDCYGTIDPGSLNAPTTLTVGGDLTFRNGSTYRAEISPTAGDLIDVTGTVTIEPGSWVEVVPYGSGGYQSKTYTILTSTNVISGTFTGVNITSPLFEGTLAYDDYNVYFVLAASPGFAKFVTESNAYAVASYFDTLDPDSGSDLEYVFDELNSLSSDELNDAFDQLHPAIFKGSALAQEANSAKIASLQANRAHSFYGPCCIKGEGCFKNGFWIAPYGDLYDQNTVGELKGFDAKSGGVLAGYDRKILSHTYLGLDAGYSYSSLNWNRHRGNGEINSVYGGLYAFWFNNCCYFNASAYGVYNDYSGKRNIEFAEINRTAKNSHHGAEFIGHADSGVFFGNASENLEVRPNVSVDYIYIHERSFTEKEAGSLNLHVDSNNYQLWRPEAAVNFVKCFSTKSGNFIPEAGIGYIKEIRNGGKYYTANLVGQPGYFKISGICKNADLLAPSVFFNFLSNNGRNSFSLGYTGEFGKHRNENNFFMQGIFKF